MPRGENLKRIPPEERVKWLGMELLPPGWKRGKIYLKAPAEVFDALERLNPQQRGEVVQAGLLASGLLKEGGQDGQEAGQ